MTPHPIQVEIARLRRRAWRLAWMQAASRFAAVVVAALLLWLVSDYLFRYREPGLRAVGLAAILAAGAWAAWRFLAPMTTWRLSDVDVARRVDRRFASADRRVASALEFLAAAEGGERDADRGSARLRDAVVSDASRSLSGIKFAEVLDSRPTFQAASIALAAAGFAMLLYVVSPDAARLAIARLNPGADVPWPPRHRLVFEPEITHLAQGDAFEARVVERGGNLPDEVWIEYAATENRPAGVAADSRHLMQPLGDAMVARRENVRSSFWYRATGGDDTSMDWRRLTVVEPPRLAACRIAVHPPDYTAWPSADSPRAIRALVGSHVEIEATASRPLTTASVVLESGKRIPLAIDADGLKLSLPAGADAVADDLTWRIDDSRSYRFELAARDGTQTSAARDEQWEIQPIVDLPPVVSIEQPGDVVYATARANVAVRLAASDDLAIARVAIERRIRRGNDRPAASTAESDGSGVESFEVYAASPPSDGETGLGRWPRGDRVGPLESTWNLASLRVSPGDTVEYEAVAWDRQGTETRTATSRIFVVSREEFVERAIDQQVHIAEQLTRGLELARQSQRLLAGLLIKARQSGSFDESDRDSLRAVETEHRQLSRILFEPVSGAAAMCASLLAGLTSNGVELPEGNRRLAEMLAELGRLEREEFGPFDRTLADAWAAVRSPRMSPVEFAGAIGRVAARQERIVESLARLHAGLARWDSVRRVAREVAEIRRVEQGLASRATELARSTLGLRPDELPADTLAELGRLVESQRDLRRRFDRTQSRLDKLRTTLATDDPHAAGIVVDALDYLVANPVAGDLSSAADQIEANRLAQAARTQRSAIDALGELMSLLDNRPEEDPQRRMERLAQAIERTGELSAKFDALATEVDRVAATIDEGRRAAAMTVLDPHRKLLAGAIRQVSREAIRLEAMLAAERLARAAAGIDALGQLVAERPAEWPAARIAIRNDLVSAERFLQASRRQIESQQIRQRLATVAEQVAKLIERQELLLAESKAFVPVAANAAEDAWRNVASEAIERQRELADETAALAATVELAAFAQVLRGAAEEMRRAADALALPKTIADAMRAQRRAIERLRQIGAATSATSPPPADVSPPADANSDPPPTPEGAFHVLEELRLLRLMQDSVNARTAALDKHRRENGLSEADRRELAALAGEQQRISELLRSAFVDAPPALNDEPMDDNSDDGKPEDDGPPIVRPPDDAPSPLGM